MVCLVSKTVDPLLGVGWRPRGGEAFAGKGHELRGELGWEESWFASCHRQDCSIY
jgi:hypothetical protein